MDMYKPPSSDPAEEPGIDGQTCPVCEGRLSWKVIYFQALIPNWYRCPHCRAKLRYDLPWFFMPFLLLGIIVAGSLFGYVMSDVNALHEDGRKWLFFFTVLPIMVLIAGVATEYCRRKRKLVRRISGQRAGRGGMS